jgi:poly(ADP-ribose) glycohydrolase
MQIFHWQQPGIVLVTQELAASLLSCAFLCLFPVGRRGEHRLPAINMDAMLAGVWGRASQVHKVHCLVNYFRRVCESMPRGVISYERKVIFYERKVVASGMEEAGWSESRTPLCSFLGGGVLRMGCVQEEIRFMLSPELIAGMLFMPAMADNETIEITGSERFNNYAGYAGKFRYAGNFLDSTPRDQFGRRHTKILAMDAKPRPGESQFHQKLLLRETSKAYCAFLPTSITSKPLLPKPAMICTFSSQ